MAKGEGSLMEQGKPAIGKAMNKTMIGSLSLGHILTDLNQGALPIMLPYFIVALGLSYASAGGFVLALTITSSVIQPVLGQLSDRHPMPWLAPVGLFVAGAGIALSSVMPSYLLIWLAIGVSGIGIAAFHPEGARLARMASGDRKATGMSFFALGGSAGFALGPLYVTPLLLAFGLGGGLFVIVPAALMSLALAWQIRRFLASQSLTEAGIKGVVRSEGEDAWWPFARLTFVVIMRSVAFAALNTFIPLYWLVNMNQTEAAGGVALTILLISGAVGTLTGGWLGDRYSRRLVAVFGLLLSCPLLFIFLSMDNPTIAMLMLFPIGITLFLANSVMVVMGQDYLPNRVGTASGVTLGLSVSLGGLAVPFLGLLADNQGIPFMLTLVAFVPLVGALAATTLAPRRAASHLSRS